MSEKKVTVEMTEQEIETLKSVVSRFKSDEKEGDDVMNIMINRVGLYVRIGVVAYLSIEADKGRMLVSNSNLEHHLMLREKWNKGGCKIDRRPVEWKGKNYCIKPYSGGIYLYAIIDGSLEGIYNFSTCIPCPNCQDPNILRYPYNNTPIIF